MVASAARAEPFRRNVGLTFGGGISFGRIECDVQMCFESRVAGVIDGHVGTMVAPRVAVVAEAWGTSYEVGDRTVTRAMVGAGLRSWPTPRVWLSATAGLSSERIRTNLEMAQIDDMVGLAPVGTLSIGFELVSRAAFALDLHVRTGAVLLDDGVRGRPMTVGVGVSWY